MGIFNLNLKINMASKKKKEKITSFDDLPPVPPQVGETPENPAII